MLRQLMRPASDLVQTPLDQWSRSQGLLGRALAEARQRQTGAPRRFADAFTGNLTGAVGGDALLTYLGAPQ
jgi:hypothetical protein